MLPSIDGDGHSKDVVRIAALGDLHYSRTSTQGSLQPLFAQITEAADILVLCGDLTDFGLPEEARALAREIAARSRFRPSACSAITTSSPASRTRSDRF